MTIQPSSQLLIYQTPGGQTRLEVRLDDKRLQSPIQLFDYFDELLRRIQDIRISEKRFSRRSRTSMPARIPWPTKEQRRE